MASAASNPLVAEKDKVAHVANGTPAGAGSESVNCGGILSTVGVRLIQTFIFMYDFVSFPFYLAYQRPWNATNAARTIRAHPIERTKDSITFKPIDKTCPELETFKVHIAKAKEHLCLF